MAEIVLGIGCAHTPQLHTAAKDWMIRGARDKQDGVAFWYKGERLKYAEVEQRRKALGFDPDLSAEFGETSLARAHRAIDSLHDVYRNSGADVMVIFGNDQHEIFMNRVSPAFAVLAGESFENMPRNADQIGRLPPGIHLADPGHIPDEHTVYPGHPELAVHIIKSLTAAEFDVAASFEQPRVEEENSMMSGMPHAYGFIYKQLMRDHVIPHVPVNTNTFFPPNQPTAARCLKMGKVVGDAIASWDSPAKVCVVATGGLSHFLVDAEWDAEFLEVLMSEDLERISQWHEGYYQAGSSECKSWIACAAALAGTGLKPHLQDYVPLYRTPAGTGSSCGFVTWTR
jgi:hypothetical protein